MRGPPGIRDLRHKSCVIYNLPGCVVGPKTCYLRARQLNRVIGGHLDPALSGDFGRSGFIRLIPALVLVLSIPALWKFMCGRGGHEKTIGELKSGLAFSTIPTRHDGANSAWQQLVVLAHNLLINFQIEGGATKRNRTRKRNAVFLLRRTATLRFELFNRARILVRPGGVARLRMQANKRVRDVYSDMVAALSGGA